MHLQHLACSEVPNSELPVAVCQCPGEWCILSRLLITGAQYSVLSAARREERINTAHGFRIFHPAPDGLIPTWKHQGRGRGGAKLLCSSCPGSRAGDCSREEGMRETQTQRHSHMTRNTYRKGAPHIPWVGPKSQKLTTSLTVTEGVHLELTVT